VPRAQVEVLPELVVDAGLLGGVDDVLYWRAAARLRDRVAGAALVDRAVAVVVVARHLLALESEPLGLGDRQRRQRAHDHAAREPVQRAAAVAVGVAAAQSGKALAGWVRI